MKEFLKKHRNDIVFVLALIIGIVYTIHNHRVRVAYLNTIETQNDSLVRYQVEHRVLRNRIDTLTARNVKLNIELILNDCNQYKIHEKINSIPDDSLLFYADSILSKPILRETGTKKDKTRSFGSTIKKLLGIQRPVSGPKGESCGGDCG